MAYMMLKELYHRTPTRARQVVEAELESRRQSAATFHWDYSVGEDPIFVVPINSLLVGMEDIWRREIRIGGLWGKLPPAALHHYYFELLTDELKSTNEIESIYSTRREVADAIELAQGKTGIGSQEGKPLPADGHHRRFKEMAQQYMALPGLELPGFRTHVESDRTLRFPSDTVELRTMYDQLLGKEIAEQDLPDGMLFRTGPVAITDGVRDIHSGVSGEANIEARLGTMISSALYGSESFELLSVFVEHFMFEHTHPFYDGNGRMGRFLMCMRLAEVVSIHSALSFSPELFRQKKRYYSAFETAEHPLNRGDLTMFAVDMLSMFRSAQERLEDSLVHRLEQLEALQNNIQRMIDSQPKDSLSQEALNILYVLGQKSLFGTRTGLSLDDLAHFLSCTKYKARQALTELEAQDLVEQLKRRPIVVCLGDKALERLGIHRDSYRSDE